MISKVINFITTDIWRIRARDLSRPKWFLIKHLRIILAALRGFNEDKCQLRASALTFYSLLSIVPVVAMAFGVAKGFGFEKLLEKQLLERMPGQEEVIAQVIGFANSFLENTKGGMVAGIGVVILFWTVVKVLGNIEKSFNDIWGIREARSMGRKFSDYLSLMLLCPFLMVVSSSATVFIATQITTIAERIELLGFFSPAISFFVNLLPYVVIWVLFIFVYMFMPNTKVSYRSGIIAGIVAGTIYQIVQWGYITFQVGMAKYNAIYGSFAALPLFLVWLQLSWLIVLFGAEISFAHQNIDTYEFEPDCLKVSSAFKKLISLRITHLSIKNFSQGKKPLTDTEISHILDIPIRLVRQVIYELVECGILSESNGHLYKQLAYQPARDPDDISIKYVIDALESRGSNAIPTAETKELQSLTESLSEFNIAVEKSPANRILKDI